MILDMSRYFIYVLYISRLLIDLYFLAIALGFFFKYYHFVLLFSVIFLFLCFMHKISNKWLIISSIIILPIYIFLLWYFTDYFSFIWLHIHGHIINVIGLCHSYWYYNFQPINLKKLKKKDEDQDAYLDSDMAFITVFLIHIFFEFAYYLVNPPYLMLIPPRK